MKEEQIEELASKIIDMLSIDPFYLKFKLQHEDATVIRIDDINIIDNIKKDNNGNYSFEGKAIIDIEGKMPNVLYHIYGQLNEAKTDILNSVMVYDLDDFVEKKVQELFLLHNCTFEIEDHTTISTITDIENFGMWSDSNGYGFKGDGRVTTKIEGGTDTFSVHFDGKLEQKGEEYTISRPVKVERK